MRRIIKINNKILIYFYFFKQNDKLAKYVNFSRVKNFLKISGQLFPTRRRQEGCWRTNKKKNIASPFFVSDRIVKCGNRGGCLKKICSGGMKKMRISKEISFNRWQTKAEIFVFYVEKTIIYKRKRWKQSDGS